MDMARQNVPEQSVYPYHLTARTNNKEWFELPLDQVWQIFEEQLFFLSHGFNFEIHGFVLMNNHFHLLVKTPKSNLSQGMQWFMRETSRQINREANRINRVWGSRYFRSMIQNYHYYTHAYKYIYHNPVQAGLTKTALEYKYSSLQRLLGLRHLAFPVYDTTLWDTNIDSYLNWLNKKPYEDNWNTVKKSLTRPIFSLPKCRKTKRDHSLENDLL